MCVCVYKYRNDKQMFLEKIICDVGLKIDRNVGKKTQKMDRDVKLLSFMYTLATDCIILCMSSTTPMAHMQ